MSISKADIKTYDNLLSIVDQSVALLLTTEIDKFEDNLNKSMSLMSEAVGACRGYICNNHIYGGEFCVTQIYEWPKDSSVERKSEYLRNVPYRKMPPGWEDALSEGECINILIRDMQNGDMRDMLLSSGVLSVFLSPIFMGDDFWGFVAFENCLSEELFSKNEAAILHSACLLIGNAFLYHEMIITLRNAAEEAKAANKAKSTFLASMSHEVRTPLNAILGITEILLRSEELHKNAYEHLVKIHNSGEMLLGIVNDILDLSKIEAGKFELMPDEYEPASMINDTIMLNLMRLENKSIDLKLIIDESIPTVLFGDELRIKQIINNLLSNAFKYTEEGVVALSFKIEDENADGRLVLVINVSDTGRGMTDEQVKTLFDEYTRFYHIGVRSTEGTGLGMSITRNLLKLMDGEISVESKLHRGTSITVRIPQRRISKDVLGRDFADKLQEFRAVEMRQAKKTNIVYEPMPYGNVLIVEDVEINLFVAQGMLAPYGLSVDAVTSGFQVIEKIKAGNVYDVIFLDYMMPKMDGMETVGIIRKLGYTAPIVALTANAVVGQMDVMLSNGFNDYISKPIDVRFLNNVLKKYVRDKQPAKIIEAAHRQGKSREYAADKRPPISVLSVSSKLMKIFVKDALKTVSVLEGLSAKAGAYKDEDIILYTTSFHGMKNALFNVGERHLSVIAADLEDAGWKKDIGKIVGGTQGFINELKAVISRFSANEAVELPAVVMTEDDCTYLRGMLRELTEASKAYDTQTSKEILAELRKRAWRADIKKQLNIIINRSLSGDVEGVLAAVDETHLLIG